MRRAALLLLVWGAAACRDPEPAPAPPTAKAAVDAGDSTTAWDERDAALSRSLARLEALTPKRPRPPSPDGEAPTLAREAEPSPSPRAGDPSPASRDVETAAEGPARSQDGKASASPVTEEPGAARSPGDKTSPVAGDDGAPSSPDFEAPPTTPVEAPSSVAAVRCVPAPLEAALAALGRLRTQRPSAVPTCVALAALRAQDSLAQLSQREGGNLEALVSVSVPEGQASLAQCALATAWARLRFAAGEGSGGEHALRLAFAADGRCPEGFLLRVERAFAENQLQEAREQAERGAARNPGDGRLRGWLSRLAREGRAEAGATVKRSAHFALSLDGALRPEVAEDTLATLEEAAPRINALYGYTPRDVVAVVLYGGQTFDGLRHVSWAAGYYDGKVRMPAGGAPGQTLSFKEVLFHEYGHAVTSRAAGGLPVPPWLNEGLAQRAALLASDNGHPTCAQGHDLALRELAATGFGADARKVRLAYVTALHAADRFVERFGATAAQQVLLETARAGDFAKAFERVTRERPDAFIAAFDLEKSQPR
jgi:hypothetical protein